MTHPYPVSSGVVTAVEPFGVFVTLDDGRTAVLEVVNFADDGPHQLSDYPKVGTRVVGVVVGIARGQPRLSMRPKDMARGKR